jgi:hypothetical protein
MNNFALIVPVMVALLLVCSIWRVSALGWQVAHDLRNESDRPHYVRVLGWALTAFLVVLGGLLTWALYKTVGAVVSW